jgi:hypothetical protein
MDPTATLTELLASLADQDRETACERLAALCDWLKKDGAFPTLPCESVSKRYNGWKNYETWAVSLWLNNDEGTYLFCRRLAREAFAEADDCEQVNDEIWTVEEARKFLLADKLKEYIAELNPLGETASLFTDLLNATLQEVHFEEVADGFLEDLEP